MAKIKLTNIELSTILSAADAKELDFASYRTCYAGLAYNLDANGPYGLENLAEEKRARDISDAIINGNLSHISKGYILPSARHPRTAGDALRACQRAGLV
jgi:hypothetical protein